MKVGALVTARMGSSRLTDKHLRLIRERQCLTYLLDRIEKTFANEIARGSLVIVLATGNATRNQPLADLCKERTTIPFFGDDDNIPLRHLQAAEQLGLDAMISLDGDDLLCAPEAMRSVHDQLLAGKSLVKTSGLPLGMNAWGYTQSAIRDALHEVNLSLLETGWGRIFDDMPLHTSDLNCPNADAVRATLDYDQDLTFFSRVINEISGWAHMSTADLVNEIMTREIHKENAGLNEQYWANFTRHITFENFKDPA